MADEYIKRFDVRDALYSAIIEWNKDCGIARMEYLRIRLNNVPAADVRPVVHAKITSDGACSACGSYMPTDTRYDAIFGDEVHFCYCCGAMLDADMREVQDG